MTEPCDLARDAFVLPGSAALERLLADDSRTARTGTRPGQPPGRAADRRSARVTGFRVIRGAPAFRSALTHAGTALKAPYFQAADGATARRLAPRRCHSLDEIHRRYAP